MGKARHEICTKEAPFKAAPYHPDAVVRSREEVADVWPHYCCPNCGLDTILPEWNTVSARKLLGPG